MELGQALGVPQAATSRYELGQAKPPLEYLAAIARYGKVTLDWLIRGED